jgi:hypothetical protein
MGLRVGLDDVKKRKCYVLPGLELQPLGRPARSQSQRRLRYPGSQILMKVSIYIYIYIFLMGINAVFF